MSSSSSMEWKMHQLQERRMRRRMRIRKIRQAYGKNEDNEDWISEREVNGETEDDGDMISERKRNIREVDAENEDNGDRISKRKIYIREVDAENEHNGDRISERKISIAREVDGENEVYGPDRISALPDSLLVHMINFMDTKSAVQTCVLSKRWNDLSKCLTNLTFHSDLPSECLDRSFEKFESWVLSSRDDSYPLLNLTIESWIDADVQDRVIKYALLHNVQKLKMNINSTTNRPNFRSLPLIFRSQSLTSLELSNKLSPSKLKLPKSLHLPALKSLHLAYVTFTNSDKDRVEPFSNCHVLNTLVLRNFSLNAQVLSISNSTLSSLTIFEGQACSIVLSTPNLSSFSITGSFGHQLSSTVDLSFLGEVNIYMPWSERSLDGKSSIIIKWLEVLANVKILTIGSCAIQTILHDLLNPISTRPQPPKFVRLESLKVKVGNPLSTKNTSDEKVTRAVEYLLQNSPMPRFDIIRSA